ncbi:biotin--[acetyl-CoA-carboxylase] ligase [Sphingomonas sp. URHD0057]|uniref:biotin--[acetyl-CoA-carboxylase] ligase n=1 Tax=Sphingomonas sp. URHD0057 TaxID=1380389 RepID=UPI0006871852
MVESTGSTNADILADQERVEGDWLVALEQHSGRGRQGREWVSAKGNFYGSTLVTMKAADPPAPSLSLAAGLALIEAVELAVPARGLVLKWPNDLMLQGRKLAGILLERSGDRVAVGFGVNLASAPPLADRQAAALGGKVAPQVFAPLLAGSLARLLQLWRSTEIPALGRAWQERAHPLGTRLSVHVNKEETVTGLFAGLEPDGALRLQREDGAIDIIRAGDVDLA